jgi:predicted GNAT superfamily acetyltransferase
MTGGYRIGVATRDDIAGVLELQDHNLRKNGGALSVPMSRAWLEGAIDDMPIIIASKEGRLVGYAVSSPLTAQSDDPVLHAMLAAHPGSPGCYVYGPICVADSERGNGVARTMFEALRSRLPGRQGFTFIRADNAVSRKVHAGLGMREAATFSVAGIDYVVVAYVG